MHDHDDDSLDPPTMPGADASNPAPPLTPPATPPAPPSAAPLVNELSQGRVPDSPPNIDPTAKPPPYQPPSRSDATGLRPDPYGSEIPDDDPRVYRGPSRDDTTGLRPDPYPPPTTPPSGRSPPVYVGPSRDDTTGLRPDPYFNPPAHSMDGSGDPAASRSRDTTPPPSGPHSARAASSPPPAGEGDARLPAVRFHFSSDEDDAPEWRVSRIVVEEALDDTFSAVVDLVAEEATYDIAALLGRSAKIEIARDHGTRRVLGIVSRVDRLGTAGAKLIVRAHVVPAFALLAQTCDSRIFQEKTVPEIIEAVLSESFAPYERELRLDLARSDYATREYCVQHRESDHDFVRRLSAEEGIAFFFEHSGDSEVMVFFDANDALPPCLTMGGGAVPVSNAASGTETTEVVRGFEWTRSLETTSVVLREHDWTRPSLALTFANRGEDVRGRDRERYVYPGGFTVGGYDEGGHRYATDDGATRARITREAHAKREQRGRGSASVIGLVAGGTFELSGNASAELDRKYVVVRTRHEGHAPEALEGEGADARDPERGERYLNAFEVIPKDVPWRPTPPSRHTRTTMRGPQTAIVVGPAGEEIHTDAHGRVKVQLHWDREGSRDDHSSCWLRVAHRWAGAGWGFLFTPRIGMEVVVEFLDGNPDRPLVTGCVYDGQHPPPYELPARKTVSTIKSQSSPGGNGFNELRFEDAAGEEEVFVHAQRNLVEKVLHDHSTNVGHDHSNHVRRNDSESVGGAQSLSVGGDRTKHVTGNETRSISQNRSASVQGNEALDVSGSRGVRVVGDEEHAVYGNLSRTRHIAETRTIGTDRTTKVGGKDKTTVGLTSSITAGEHNELRQGLVNSLVLRDNRAELSTPDLTRVMAPGSTLEVRQGGEIWVNANTEIRLQVGASKLVIAPDKISLETPQLECTVGGSSRIVASSSGVTVSGANVTSQATMLNMILGALVSIN